MLATGRFSAFVLVCYEWSVSPVNKVKKSRVNNLWVIKTSSASKIHHSAKKKKNSFLYQIREKDETIFFFNIIKIRCFPCFWGRMWLTSCELQVVTSFHRHVTLLAQWHFVTQMIFKGNHWNAFIRRMVHALSLTRSQLLCCITIHRQLFLKR